MLPRCLTREYEESMIYSQDECENEEERKDEHEEEEHS